MSQLLRVITLFHGAWSMVPEELCTDKNKHHEIKTISAKSYIMGEINREQS